MKSTGITEVSKFSVDLTATTAKVTAIRLGSFVEADAMTGYMAIVKRTIDHAEQ